MSSDPNQRCMVCRAIGFVVAAIVVGLITWWLVGKVAVWLAILAFLGLFALGLWLVLKYCGEPVSYSAGAAVGAAAGAVAATGASARAVSAHKFEGGCEHIKTHADHNPIDSHDCHCSVCKSVTGQDTTHVTFFNHGELKVSNEANLQRQPFNANNPDGPLELCVCGDCGTPIMLDDKEGRVRAIVPNLMGHDPAAMPTTYHAFYDPATGVPRPNDGKPVHEGLRPDFVWPEGHTPAASGYSGGCAHVQTHSDHDPIDSHDCHCSVCKSVTGQDTTHVTFFNHGDLQVSDASKLTRQPFNANNPDGPLELCVCGDCGTPIMLDDKHKRVRAIVPNLMGHDPAAMPTTYHAFYDPATGVPRPNDGKPVHEGLRPDFTWPEGDGSAARAAEMAALRSNAGEVERLAEEAGSRTDAGADAAAKAAEEARAAKAAEEARAAKAAEEARAAKAAEEARAAKAAEEARAAKAKADADSEAARLRAETEAAKARAEAAAAKTAAAAVAGGAAAGAGAKAVADGVTGRGTTASAGVKPAGITGPRGGKADDLKRIKGVGPAMEKMVNGMGFYHFDQVAAWGDEEVAWVDDNLEGFKGRVTRDRWVPQARLLADGRVVSDEVMERIRAGEDVDLTDYDNDGVSEGRAGEGSKPATLSGPRGGQADDLKQIKGVGPKLEGVVNSLGFYHFDQIASWSADEVAWVDAQLKFKGRIDRDGWIEQAKILAAGGTTAFSKKVDKGDVY